MPVELSGPSSWNCPTGFLVAASLCWLAAGSGCGGGPGTSRVELSKSSRVEVVHSGRSVSRRQVAPDEAWTEVSPGGDVLPAEKSELPAEKPEHRQAQAKQQTTRSDDPRARSPAKVGPVARPAATEPPPTALDAGSKKTFPQQTSPPRSPPNDEDDGKGTGADKQERIAKSVAAYLEAVRSSDLTLAEKAFRGLSRAPREIIPRLILEVHNRASTSLRQIDVRVVQNEPVTFFDEEKQEFTYRIKGLGPLGPSVLDDVAVGPVKDGRGWRVRLRSFQGFSLGVVIRAALLNRLKSTRFPLFAEGPDLVRWWQAYYDRALGRS